METSSVPSFHSANDDYARGSEELKCLTNGLWALVEMISSRGEMLSHKFKLGGCSGLNGGFPSPTLPEKDMSTQYL